MKNCKSCGKVMISNSDFCPTCREASKKKSSYIRKNATFNPNSKKQMSVWNWCCTETNNFKDQNFADFVREKLEWCMDHERGLK